MTKAEAIAKIQAEERRTVLSMQSTILPDVAAGKPIGFYECCFYYIPRGVLTEEEEWAAFVEANRSAISEVVGYPVTLEEADIMGNGHGSWLVTRAS